MVLDAPARSSLAAKVRSTPSNKSAMHTSKGQHQDVK